MFNYSFNHLLYLSGLDYSEISENQRKEKKNELHWPFGPFPEFKLIVFIDTDGCDWLYRSFTVFQK